MKNIYDFYDYSDVNEYTINNLEDDVSEIESLAESVQLRSKKKNNMMTYDECEDISIPFNRHDKFEKKDFRGFKYDQNNLALERNPTAELKYLDGEWPVYETEALEDSIESLKDYVNDLKDKNDEITKSLKKKFKYLSKR